MIFSYLFHLFIFELNSLLHVTSKQPSELCNIGYLESDGKLIELDESVLNRRHCDCIYSIYVICSTVSLLICKKSYTPVQMVSL